MTERKPRKDAARNRACLLAAAEDLFVRRAGAQDVTMAEVAAAAGVGKGTLFRAFGDRTGLIRELYAARLEPLERAVAEGPPPLGPAAPPRERVPALLDALLCFKLDHRHLAPALEAAGDSGSPYDAGYYDRWHALLRDALTGLPGFGDGAFAAHALLAAVRADLVEHLAGARGVEREELRARLAEFIDRVLGASPAAGGGPGEG
ncbi:TetR family transcriptional regulator [Streptomyces sp. NPDC047017]|uniref:TetR/AcrR family transcriptional regulator n=1 Tax=Streptomyces sp. NPDC047017 TaxID=3155024 RepID=UPI0033DFB5C3